MNIVKNKAIKEALQARWKEMDITKHSIIVKDAAERAPEMKITADRLSKWITNYQFNGKTAGLSEQQVLWLLVRWGIDISLNIGVPKLEKGKLNFVVAPYNELECLKKLKIIFPKK